MSSALMNTMNAHPPRLPATAPRGLWPTLLATLGALLLSTGCETPAPSTPLTEQDTRPYSDIALQVGDIIKVSFPGAPNLNSIQPIRRDGKIVLEHAGEVAALGKSPSELEKDLLKVYESELVNKQVIVTVESSEYEVYVSGAVLRPGKIAVKRPITVLEAIMEAGGFDETRAKATQVTVIRQENQAQRHYRLNVDAMLKGTSTITFYLRPQDIIHVPSRGML